MINENVANESHNLIASFTSNNTAFVGVIIEQTPPRFQFTSVFYSTVDGVPFTVVNASNGWLDQAYRTITLDSPASGDFLTWLEANAVKQ